MKTFKTLLLVSALVIIFMSFALPKVNKFSSRNQQLVYTSTELLTENSDEDYYNIPDSVSYNGKKMIQKKGPLQLSTECSHNFYLVGDSQNNTAFLYAEITADSFSPINKSRTPLNISIVIDRSGSMSGDKMKYVKEAACLIVDQLNNNDFVSIVTYDDNVGVERKSTPVTDKIEIKKLINSIETDGSTNLEGGMKEGFNQVKSSFKQGFVNRVLLLSDGLANVGISDPVILSRYAFDMKNRENITLSTFGVGKDYNENLMTQLAEEGSGNYYYIKNPNETSGIISKELDGLLNVVAQNTQLKLILPEEISLKRIYGFNYTRNGNELIIDIKDIFSKEKKAILMKVGILPSAKNQINFVSRLLFENATDNHKTEEIRNTNSILPTTDKNLYLNNFSESVMQQCIVFESNDMMEKAIKNADNRRFDSARVQGTYTYNWIDNNSKKVRTNDEMSKQKESISKYNSNLKDAETKSTDDYKLMQKESKYENYNVRKKK